MMILCIMCMFCLFFPPLLIPGFLAKSCSCLIIIASIVIGAIRLKSPDKLGAACAESLGEFAQLKDGTPVTWRD